MGEGGRRWEKVGGGRRRWEKVGEGGRRWEKLGEAGRSWEKLGETQATIASVKLKGTKKNPGYNGPLMNTVWE